MAERSTPGAGQLRVNRTLVIPVGELRWRVSTPGGPGGQHANKTSSKVEVRFDIASSPSLGPRQRSRLLERIGPVARASSSQDRSQARNRQIALERLAERLAVALRVETPRRPTKPTTGSTVRRLEAKRRRSTTKQRRSESADLD
jgi:ribosome-associated protein